MRRPIASALLLLLLASCATTTATSTSPAVVRVPVEIVNNRVHMAVSVNGGPPANFILDTGAGMSPLAKEYADKVGIRGERSGHATGAGGAVPVQVTNNVRFGFGGLELEADHVALIPFEALALRIGHGIDGVLGRNVFARWITEFDYAASQVSFHPPAAWQPPPGAVAVPFETHRGLPHVRARITLDDGRTLEAKLMVDTGAGNPLILKKHFADKHRIDTSALVETSAGLGVGGATRERIGRTARLEFGGITIEKPVTMFSVSTSGALGDAESDGILGGEILRRFRFIADYPHDRLLFVPTSAVQEAFEYDMSGLQLTARDTSFEIIDVFGVRPDSPAAEAGIRAGDELRAVDGRAIAASQLSDVREWFREAGKSYTLTVRRDGVERNVTVVTRRMI